MMFPRTVAFLLPVTGSLLLSPAPAVAADDLASASPKVERVALFKNGTGFLTGRAALPAGAAEVRLGQLPIPSLGTFWVSYPRDLPVRNLVAAMEDVEEKVGFRNLGDLLAANPGKRVVLRTGNGGGDVLEGVLLESGPAPEARTEDPYFMGGRSEGPSSPFPTGNLLLLRTDRGIVALNAGSVARADFPDGDAITASTRLSREPAVRLQLDRPAGTADSVTVTCLARGLTWAPGYRIDLSDPETARFHARALVVNELMDLDDVTLDLVTGFPNLAFADVASPLALSRSLSQFLASLGGGGSVGDLLTRQAVMSNALVGGFGESEAAFPPPSGGQIAEDLFLYPVEDFSLKRGETAWVPLFSADMPYKHVYTWEVPDFLDTNEHYRNDGGAGDTGEEVWHSCRLVNVLDMPLTTAPAEFMTGGSLAGQDICHYTAPGEETTIRINRALSILAEQTEVETERVRNAETFGTRLYDRITLTGELKIRSRLDRTVHAEVTKELSGDVVSAAPEAGDVVTARGLKRANPRHVLTWKLDLEPMEELTLTYTYRVYVRS